MSAEQLTFGQISAPIPAELQLCFDLRTCFVGARTVRRRHVGLSDPWNWALALPAILTACIIAYGCHSWFSITGGALAAPPALISQPVTQPRPAESVIATASPKGSETNHHASMNSAVPERAMPAVPVLVADPVAAADVLGPDDALMMTESVQREAAGTIQPTSSLGRDVGVV